MNSLSQLEYWITEAHDTSIPRFARGARIQGMSIIAPQLPPTQQHIEPAEAESHGLAAEDVACSDSIGIAVEPGQRLRWWRVPGITLRFLWDSSCLCLLLAIAAALPVIQLAALGYLLTAAGRMADRQPITRALPGRRLAGRLGVFCAWAYLLWLPVSLLMQRAYHAQLVLPGSEVASNAAVLAFVFTGIWVSWVSWAALRGGTWKQFLWPRPILFLKTIWRPSTWSRAADQLWFTYQRTQFFQLWWLGCRAALGALVWLFLPVSLVVFGLRQENAPAAGLVGLIGALALAYVLMVIPQMQIHFAVTRRFRDLFALREARRKFTFAPFAITLAVVLTLALCIPVYLLRIEPLPQELAWLPNLVYVALLLPAKILLGCALGYANKRARPRPRLVRWSAKTVFFAAALFYVGSLYVAQLVAKQGVYVMYTEHSVLVPTPLLSP